MITYREVFFSPRRFPCDKWENYFDIYDRSLGRYYGQPITYLEIGVYKGGSLEVARSLFGPDATILGLDIDESCRRLAGEPFVDEIYIGSQTDRQLLAEIVGGHPGIDIVIDDGSHRQSDMVTTFATLFPLLKQGAVYLVEDVSTVYSRDHQDTASGIDAMDYFRSLAGRLNTAYLGFADIEGRFRLPRDARTPRRQPRDLSTEIKSISFYESVIVFEKGARPEPLRLVL